MARLQAFECRWQMGHIVTFQMPCVSSPPDGYLAAGSRTTADGGQIGKQVGGKKKQAKKQLGLECDIVLKENLKFIRVALDLIECIHIAKLRPNESKRWYTFEKRQQ